MKTRTVRSKGGRSGKTVSAKSLFSLPLRGVLGGIGIAAAVLDSVALGTWLAALPDDFCPFLARFASGEDGVGVVGVALRRDPEAWRSSPSLPAAGVLRFFCGAGTNMRAVVWVCASEGVWGEVEECVLYGRRREGERGGLDQALGVSR